ncbi:MAG: ABC transporter permease [Myxococcota bacterium]|nr:ABC transporter permease [Myxococcota bacterium]
MQDLSLAFRTAFEMVVGRDPVLVEIVLLSLQVTLSALALACAMGLPAGAALAVVRFPGRRAAVALLNTLMGLPPVVVGLLVYVVLSRSGPLGFLGLLFTPTAMVIAQTLLILPIVAALTRQVVEDLEEEMGEELRALGAGRLRRVGTLLLEGRYALATAVLAGFGRAIAEVGAVLIVGGNIAHVTRVMTTAIAMETNRGELALALGLGIVLIGLALAVNGAAELVQRVAQRVGA